MKYKKFRDTGSLEQTVMCVSKNRLRNSLMGPKGICNGQRNIRKSKRNKEEKIVYADAKLGITAEWRLPDQEEVGFPKGDCQGKASKMGSFLSEWFGLSNEQIEWFFGWFVLAVIPGVLFSTI